MNLSISGDKLMISFRYDPRLVSVVKLLPGRMFEKKMRCWSVPVDHLETTLNMLLPTGFLADKEVLALLDEQVKRNKALSEIKIDPSRYVGDLPLYDFQKIGAMWMREQLGCLLADVPGLGKTIQTIAALKEFKSGNFLVVCPASLKYSWRNEIRKWTDDFIVVVDGDKKKRAAAWEFEARWHIANYELLIRDYEEISKQKWDAIVCDEATRLSNPKAVSVRALKKIPAKKKLALTGTPISNSPIDLWSILDWCRPGYLGSFYNFRNDYAEVDGWGRITSYRNLGRLANTIAPILLRRTKEEVFTDFPRKTIENVEFTLSPEERRVYEGVRTLVFDEIAPFLSGVDKSSMGILPVKMLRLKQVTDHLRLVGDGERSTKLDTLRDLLEPIIASGEKTIIFTQFAEMAKILFAELAGPERFLIEGSVAAVDRQTYVDAFQAEKGAALMIMTEAGAYGLNLQAASYVVHYDAPWSIAKLQQREDRAHRIGQTKPVTVYNLIAKDTIDEYVAKVLHKKQKYSTELLQDADRLEAAGIDEEDIKAILRI